MTPDSFADRLVLVLSRRADAYRWTVPPTGFWSAVVGTLGRDKRGALPESQTAGPRRSASGEVRTRFTILAGLSAAIGVAIVVALVLYTASGGTKQYSPQGPFQPPVAEVPWGDDSSSTPPTQAPSLAPAPTGASSSSVSVPPAGQLFPVFVRGATSFDMIGFLTGPFLTSGSMDPGFGVRPGEHVRLTCFAYGDAVGPLSNRVWYLAQNADRPLVRGLPDVGYLSADFIDSGLPPNEVVEGIPACRR